MYPYMNTLEYDMTIWVFSDAARPSEYGQIGFLVGLLNGPLQKASIFMLSFGYHIRPIVL